jgi:hypothetical protein
VVERRNPFAPWAQPSPATAVSNLEKRADMAARALDQAQRDLAAARQRVPDEDDEEMKASYRRGALAERERIRLILTSPVAARQTHLAEAYAFDSDDSADKAIAMMKSCAAAASQRTAKETSDLIVLAGKKARGDSPAKPRPAQKFSWQRRSKASWPQRKRGTKNDRAHRI